MPVSVPIESITDGPDVVWNHIDGPLLCWAGNMHWLTFGERVRLFFGRTSVFAIARGQWPHLAKLYDQHAAK